MINMQRVRRIKSAIYTIMVILLFLPLVLLIALCISMIGFLRDTSSSLVRIESYIAGEPVPGTADSSNDALLEPENQAFRPQDKEEGQMSASQADTPLETDEEPSDTEPITSGLDKEPTGLQISDNPAAVSTPNIYKPESYPEILFDTVAVPQVLENDTLHLTFDNTPSTNFSDILALLDKYGVKATFFVWWSDTDDGSDFRAILEAGHSIGIHSGEPSLPLSSLYSSVDSFMADFSDIFAKIESETGVRTRLYRLPGGSVNPYNTSRQAVLSSIKTELDARGFIQHDWNSSAQDAVYPPLSMQQILSNLHTSVRKGERVVVLCHDGTGSDSTVRALDQFIPACLEEGYSFKALDYDTVPVSFLE